MAKNVNIIFVSGVHGVGKTTLIEKLRVHLVSKGNDVRVHPEFDKDKTSSGFNPGDPRFQVWYKYNILMRERKALDNNLKAYNGDEQIYLLFDRSAIDVQIYNMYYNDVDEEIDIIVDHAKRKDYHTLSFMQHGYSEMFKHYDVAFIHLGADEKGLETIQDRVNTRLEDEKHRKDWNESDFYYLKGVSDKFNEFYQKMEDHGAPVVLGLTSYDSPEEVLDRVNLAMEMQHSRLGKNFR